MIRDVLRESDKDVLIHTGTKHCHTRSNIHKTPLVKWKRKRTTILVETRHRKKKEKKEGRPFICPQLQVSKRTSTPQLLVKAVLKGYLGTAEKQRFKSAPQYAVERCPEGTLKKRHIVFKSALQFAVKCDPSRTRSTQSPPLVRGELEHELKLSHASATICSALPTSSGGATTLIFIEDGADFVTSINKRLPAPWNIST